MFRSRVVAAFAAVLVFGSLAAIAGCDWLKSSGSTGRSSPLISSLGVSPAAVLCDQKFSVSFHYDDPQGDIASATVTLLRSGDTTVRQETPLWPDTISRSSGTAAFIFTFPCDSKGGTWTISVQAQDDLGHTSNTLSGEIRLNAAG